MASARWVYALFCSENFLDEAQIIDFLNTLAARGEDVVEWLRVFKTFFIVTSDISAGDLGIIFLEYVRKTTGAEKPKGYYFITEMTDDRNGWLPKLAWTLLNNKTSTPPVIVGPSSTALPTATDDDKGLEDEIPF